MDLPIIGVKKEVEGKKNCTIEIGMERAASLSIGRSVPRKTLGSIWEAGPQHVIRKKKKEERRKDRKLSYFSDAISSTLPALC